MNIKQLLDLNQANISIEGLVATVQTAYPAKGGTGDRGPWTLHSMILGDGTGTIRLAMFLDGQDAPCPVSQGQEIVVSALPGQGGKPRGAFTTKRGENLEIKVVDPACLSLSGGRSPSGPTPTPAQGQNVAPAASSGRPGASQAQVSLGEFKDRYQEALREVAFAVNQLQVSLSADALVRGANLWMMCWMKGCGQHGSLDWPAPVGVVASGGQDDPGPKPDPEDRTWGRV